MSLNQNITVFLFVVFIFKFSFDFFFNHEFHGSPLCELHRNVFLLVWDNVISCRVNQVFVLWSGTCISLKGDIFCSKMQSFQDTEISLGICVWYELCWPSSFTFFDAYYTHFSFYLWPLCLHFFILIHSIHYYEYYS
jgi:hypothetical protein